MTASVLFHELVHVVQFRLLGARGFVRLYIRGLLSSGNYDGIPLERCAFELGYRFETERTPFDVEREVARWIAREVL